MTRIKLKYIHEYRNRHGKVHRYFRRKGSPVVRLPGLPGSPEFMEAYKIGLAGGPIVRTSRHVAGSFADLVTRYYGSAEFANLAASSQATYRYILEKHVERDGHRMVRDLPTDKARKVIEEIGASRPGMANLTRSLMIAVYEFAINIEWRKDNPFKRTKPYKLGKVHTWTDTELAAYEKRWPLGTRERLAYATLLYSAQRTSDAVKLKRSDVLRIAQQKTGTELAIPIHPALARAVRAGPANGIHIIGAAKSGQPIIADTLGRIVSRAAKKAGLIRCTAHGLRKANQRLLAEGGATTKQMQAVSGHKSLKETERYSEQANQGRLAAAAIALLPDESRT